MSSASIIIEILVIFWLSQNTMVNLQNIIQSFECKKKSHSLLQHVQSCGRLLAYEKNLISAFFFLKNKNLNLDTSQFEKDLILFEERKQNICFKKNLFINDFEVLLQNSSYKEKTNWIYKFKNLYKEDLFCN